MFFNASWRYDLPMIKLINNGKYNLVEIENGIKALALGEIFGEKSVYFLIDADVIRKTSTQNYQYYEAGFILASGRYRLYDVKSEWNFRSNKHLELSVGEGFWQGYLLPEGFPTTRKTEKRIIPIKELITKAVR